MEDTCQPTRALVPVPQWVDLHTTVNAMARLIHRSAVGSRSADELARNLSEELRKAGHIVTDTDWKEFWRRDVLAGLLLQTVVDHSSEAHHECIDMYGPPVLDKRTTELLEAVVGHALDADVDWPMLHEDFVRVCAEGCHCTEEDGEGEAFSPLRSIIVQIVERYTSVLCGEPRTKVRAFWMKDVVGVSLICATITLIAAAYLQVPMDGEDDV